MSTGLIKIIKQAAVEAVENGQPTDMRTGIVTKTNPLTIQVTPLFILQSSALIVPRHLTDYTVKVSFNWNSEYAGEHNHSCTDGSTDTEPDHRHVVKSEREKELTVHNALKVNDKVALLRQKGGQFYYILDRID